jgi:hypothetical protein
MHSIRQVEAHLHMIEELTAILESGIRYSIQRVDRTFLVTLGECVDKPLASARVNDIEQAVSWLMEQIKVHLLLSTKPGPPVMPKSGPPCG